MGKFGNNLFGKHFKASLAITFSAVVSTESIPIYSSHN